VRKADNLSPFCAVVTKSGNLNFLEPSGPVQACNGTAFTNINVSELNVCSVCTPVSKYRIFILSDNCCLSLVNVNLPRLWEVGWLGYVNMINGPKKIGNWCLLYKTMKLCIYICIYIYIYIKYLGYLLKFLTYVKFDVWNVLSLKILGQLVTVSTLVSVSYNKLLPLWAHTLLYPQSVFSSQHVLSLIQIVSHFHSDIGSLPFSSHEINLHNRIINVINHLRNLSAIGRMSRIHAIRSVFRIPAGIRYFPLP